MNNNELPAKIKKTYLKPYIERMYCGKCGKELKVSADLCKSFLSMLDNEEFKYHYHCDNCNIDYSSKNEYPKIRYEEVEDADNT